MQLQPFNWPIRVYYEDTDAGGVVYHSNYLNFLERARTEWLRTLGFEQTVLKDELGVLFVVHNMQIGFKKPAKFNDALEVQSCIQETKHCVLIFNQQIIRRHANLADEVLISATVEVVSVDAHSFKPTRLPLSIKQAVNTIITSGS